MIATVDRTDLDPTRFFIRDGSGWAKGAADILAEVFDAIADWRAVAHGNGISEGRRGCSSTPSTGFVRTPAQERAGLGPRFDRAARFANAWSDAILERYSPNTDYP